MAIGFQQLLSKITGSSPVEKCTWFIIVWGCYSRIALFLGNRSFWFDEALQVLEIKLFPFWQILHPTAAVAKVQAIDYQPAPAGFFIFQKMVIQILGDNEYVFRLFPLACGIGSLFLFYRMAKVYLKLSFVPLALMFFSLSQVLIYYSSEMHPYMSDVFFALLLYFIFEKMNAEVLTSLRIFLYSIGTAVIIWFSFPAVFVIGGLGLCLMISYFTKRDAKKLYAIILVGLVTVVSFVVYFVVYLNYLMDATVRFSIEGGSFPAGALSLKQLGWFLARGASFYNHAFMPSKYWFLGIPFFIMGTLYVYRMQRIKLLFLILPALLTMIAAMLNVYPFVGRAVLFLLPSFYILLTAGLASMRERIPDRRGLLILILFCLCLLADPILYEIENIFDPTHRVGWQREELRTVLAKIKKFKQEGDIMYIYYGAWPAFRYYAPRFGFQEKDYILGIPSRQAPLKYRQDLNNLPRNGRLWFVFSHPFGSEKRIFLEHLDHVGHKIFGVQYLGAEGYLYEWRHPAQNSLEP